MASSFTLKLDVSGFTNAQRDMLAKVKNPEAPLRKWALETGRTISREVDEHPYVREYPGGSTFRGEVRWPGAKPLYERKSGPVPPWGMVPKVHGKGTVKGRKRPSGARVKPSDVMMKDAGTMIGTFTTEPLLSQDKMAISLIAEPHYSKYQNARRPFNQPTQSDSESLTKHFGQWLDALVESMRRRTA